jgi:hypothetical protein
MDLVPGGNLTHETIGLSIVYFGWFGHKIEIDVECDEKRSETQWDIPLEDTVIVMSHTMGDVEFHFDNLTSKYVCPRKFVEVSVPTKVRPDPPAKYSAPSEIDGEINGERVSIYLKELGSANRNVVIGRAEEHPYKDEEKQNKAEQQNQLNSANRDFVNGHVEDHHRIEKDHRTEKKRKVGEQTQLAWNDDDYDVYFPLWHIIGCSESKNCGVYGNSKVCRIIGFGKRHMNSCQKITISKIPEY